MSASAVFDVRVTPRAGRTAIVGWSSTINAERASSTLLVKLAAAPVEGAANDALIALLAKALDLPKRAIHIVGGARSRNKRLQVDGVSLEEIRRRVTLPVAPG